MIKWTLFSKLLKLSLSTLLISCFILLGNFSSASCPSGFWANNFPILIDSDTLNDCWVDIWDYTLNVWATAWWTTFSILDKFNFLDSLDNKIVSLYWSNASNQWNFWWWSDWYLHFSVRTFELRNPIFWHFDWYYYCTQYTQLGSLVVQQWCTFIDNYENIEEYLSKIDKFIVVRYSTSSDIRSWICWKISEDNVAICFTVSDYFNSNLRSQITVSWTEFLDYDDVSSVAVDSPYISSDSWWSNVVSLDCNYSEIFNYLNLNWYNDYLCYWWLDNFDLYDSTITYNPVPWSWKTLWQILSYSSSWDTPNDWFVFWNWLYLDKNNSTFNSMWESYPAVYRTWFDLYHRYWWSTLVFDSVREYCAMRQLDVDFDNTMYNWQYFKNTCNTIKMNYWTWDFSNVVWVNWNWVWNHGTWSTVSNDPVVFIQNYFGKLKENFPTRYDLWWWFLPVYIITFLCAIVLFRFLSH